MRCYELKKILFISYGRKFYKSPFASYFACMSYFTYNISRTFIQCMKKKTKAIEVDCVGEKKGVTGISDPPCPYTCQN